MKLRSSGNQHNELANFPTDSTLDSLANGWKLCSDDFLVPNMKFSPNPYRRVQVGLNQNSNRGLWSNSCKWGTAASLPNPSAFSNCKLRSLEPRRNVNKKLLQRTRTHKKFRSMNFIFKKTKRSAKSVQVNTHYEQPPPVCPMVFGRGSRHFQSCSAVAEVERKVKTHWNCLLRKKRKPSSFVLDS